LALQVTTAGGRQVLGAAEVRLDADTVRDVDVPFVVDRVAPVEYRARWDGEGRAAVDAVHVVFATVPDPAPAIAVADLPHELAERPHAHPADGLAAYAAPAPPPRDGVSSGSPR